MAPRHHPESLYSACLKIVVFEVDKTAGRLFFEHGNFEDCVDSIRCVQDFLTGILPPSVFEDLSDKRNVLCALIEDDSEGLYRINSWIRDRRIKLSIYLHPSLTRFTVDPDGNELPQNLIDGMDEIFWCSHLARLENLTCLRLNVITTDEILRVVGHHCPKLRDVNIVSKIRESDIRSPSMSPSMISYCLRLCVSDLGLNYLAKCRDLRRIDMNKIIPSLIVSSGGLESSSSGISIVGVRHLVKSLPLLEHLNFGSMGRIIDAGFDQETEWPLKLRYFCEMNTSFVNIPLLEKAVPHIQHISLTAPFSVELIGDAGREYLDIARSNSIFEALANSSILKPKIYEFQNFSCTGASFKRFLLSKGKYVEELILRSVNPVTFHEICLIGEECPEIRSLSVRGLQGSRDSVQFYHRERRSSSYRFRNLENFIIYGKSWNPNVILPYILGFAKGISKISLLNTDCRYTLDSTWETLLSTNSLDKLHTLMLHSGCFISFPLLRKLALELPSLEMINFLLYSDFEVSNVKALRQELKKNNYSIRLQYLEYSVGQ